MTLGFRRFQGFLWTHSWRFSGALSEGTLEFFPNEGDAWSRYINYTLTGFNRYSAKPR